MAKYIVTVEIHTFGKDLLEIPVEAANPKEARAKAKKAYLNNEAEMDLIYASNHHNSELAVDTIDEWEVEEE